MKVESFVQQLLMLSWTLYLGDHLCHSLRSSHGGKPFFYHDEGGRIMEVRRSGIPLMKRNPCECYCLVAGDDASIHCCVQCHVTDSVCFPGSAHVTLGNGDVIKMKDLSIGDEILTASDDGSVHGTEVLGFLTFDPEVLGSYYRLTLDSGEFLLLSRSHLVFASPSNVSDLAAPMFAADVNIGQYLLVKNGNKMIPRQIVSIDLEAHKGAYVPLTSDGTLLVNGIKASAYAAFPHDLSHLFLAPFRMFSSLWAYMTPTQGDHPYITFMKAFGDIVAPSARFASHSARNDSRNYDVTRQRVVPFSEENESLADLTSSTTIAS